MYLTNDSGSMHIASALDVPTVAIFGATDHVGDRPTGTLARVVREPVECSPCLLRECPIDHRCMTAVTSDRVVREAKRTYITFVAISDLVVSHRSAVHVLIDILKHCGDDLLCGQARRRFQRFEQTRRPVLLILPIQLVRDTVGEKDDRVTLLCFDGDFVVIAVFQQGPAECPSAVTFTRSPSRQIIGGIAPALDRRQFARAGIPVHQRQRDILRIHLALQQNLIQDASSAPTDAGCAEPASATVR